MTHKTENNPMTRGDEPPAPGPSLRGVSFPANRADLVELARRNGADVEVLEALEALPDRRFTSMADLLVDYGPAPVHGRGGVGRGHHPK